MAKRKQTTNPDSDQPIDESIRPIVAIDDASFTDAEEQILNEIARNRQKANSRSMAVDDPFSEDQHQILDEITVEGFRANQNPE